MTGKIALAIVTVVALVFGLAVVADGALTANRQLRRELRQLEADHEALVRWAQDELRPWLVRHPPSETPPAPPVAIPTPTPVPTPTAVPTPTPIPSVETPPPVPEPSPTVEPSPTCIPVVELCL